MPTTYNFTGLQPFWNYDSFSIANRQIGGGTGYINTAGSTWIIEASVDPLDPAEKPTVTIDEDMNFMFSTADMMLKFHNNSPFVRRFYNSTERKHTGTGLSTDSLPRHMGLMGRHWIFNYEHCIISDGAENNPTGLELGPTGERNDWGSADGSGDFTRPDGIQKKLHYEYNGGTSYFELTTPDYMIYRFDKMDEVPGDSLYYFRLVSIVDKNGVGQYIEWENKDTGFDAVGVGSIERYRIKEVSVSTDGGSKKIPLIKFRYTSWGYNKVGEYYTDAFHLVRTMQDTVGNELRYQYDFDTDITAANHIGKLEKVTYQDGYNQAYEYTNDWAVGSPTEDDYVLTKITDRRGNEWEIAYSSAYWQIDNSDTSTPDDHTTNYAWSVVDTYTLPSGFVASGSGYTPGGAYRTVKLVRTDAESTDWPFYHNCLHGPGNVGNLMRRDVLKTDAPTWLSSQYFWDDPDSDATNDNQLYLTARPKWGTNADVVQRTEYTTANGYKLTHRTYPMVGSNPNYGVNGTVQDAQYVQYTYTTNENTVAKIEYHKDYSNSYFFSQTTHTYDSNHNLIKSISADNPDPSPGSGRDETSLDLTTYLQYDGNGNLIRSTDARGNSSSYYYGQYGAMERSVNQLGAVSKQAWDETFTRLISTTGATGGTTYYSYDPLGQMIATRDATGNISKTQYDPNGNVIGRADAKGHSGRMLYDNKNRLYKTISPSGIVNEMTLSDVGQLLMNKTTFWDEDYSTNEQVVYRRTFYDVSGRVSASSLPSGTDHGAVENDWLTQNKLAVQYTYNDNSNVLTTTDRYGQVTTNTYDTLDRRETTLTPRIPDTTSGEFIRTTHKTIYSGPMGRVSEEQIQEETSSASGTSWGVTRAYYFIRKSTYDRAGRTIITQMPDHSLPDDDGNPHTYYAYQDTYYDANGNVTQKQLRQQEHTTGSSTYSWPTYMEYDIANRVVKESKVVSDDETKYDRVETTFEYDPAGRKTSTNRGGLVVQTTYDAVGRVTGVGRGGCGSGCSAQSGQRTYAPDQPASRSAGSLPAPTSEMHWQFYEYDATGNRVKYSDALGVFASVTHDAENRPVASTDRAGRVTTTEYWPTGQVKKRTMPDGNFIGYEYDIEGRLEKVWESVPELNSGQAAGPFGGSKDIALTKTIEYYYGVKNDGTNGQNLTWTGTQLNAGDYISGVRTFTYKGAGPVYYDMVYTSNAHGQPEDTQFIDSGDAATRTSTRLYTWRGRIRQIIHPDADTLDYEYDDNLRMTAEKLDGDTEKYEYEYCLCGVVKRHKYTYDDSLSNSQTEVWTNTMDDVGRITKEYYPYPIYVDGSSKEYHSILYDFDTASRRTKYSDPTFGHSCNDTSGWGGDTEPFDESDWADVEPQRYLYGMRGGLEATGRVAGNEIMAGEGEPYFVERDAAGRIAKVVYPDNNNDVPQLEWQYSYTDDGRLKQVAAVNTGGAKDTTYGPQKYVVQFFHDDVGRLIRKAVLYNAKQDTIDTLYESKYEFDGRGQMTREQIIRYDESDGQMLVMSDTQTTYDLGRNPITIKRYDKWGWAFTETRTYARGYQITGFSTSEAGDVTVTTSGSYTYDTNNNLTGTKKLDAHRTVDMTDYQICYCAEWTFTYDRKNRLKSHTNTAMAPTRGNLWYDGRGRVWQRWEDNSSTEDWDGTLLRFVYDGGQLAQEIEFLAYVPESEWVYTYTDLTRDYLRQPGGIRQRERVAQVDTDYYLQANEGANEYKVERGLELSTTEREERKTSLDQLPNTTFENISNLATSNGYVEMYGGGTSGDTAGYDGLVQNGGRHWLAGLGRMLSRMGNNAYVAEHALHIEQDLDSFGTMGLGDSNVTGEHSCSYCSCYQVNGRRIGATGFRCWRSLPSQEDGWNCICRLMAYSCSSETCLGKGGNLKGISCAEDAGVSGLNYDITDWVDEPDFDFGGTRLCDRSEIDNMALRIYARVIAQGCIRDAALAECVMKSVYEASPGLFGPKIWCDCANLDPTKEWGYTNCNRGICIDIDSIEQKWPHLNKYYAAAGILLHELVHWCMHCKFKRPSPQQAIAASTCHRWCFPDVKLVTEADPRWRNIMYGGAGHGIYDDWSDRNNCSICGDDYYEETRTLSQGVDSVPGPVRPPGSDWIDTRLP